MSLPQNKLQLLTLAAFAGLVGCHDTCEGDIVPEGTSFKVTILEASSDCPAIVPLQAGDTLTMRAGAVWSQGGDGICTGNSSTGAPPEFPQFPMSPFKLGTCSEGPIGIGFDCEATAPDCVTGAINRKGHVRASPKLARYPERGETITTDLTLSVAVGADADAACVSNCFTKIPITVQML